MGPFRLRRKAEAKRNFARKYNVSQAQNLGMITPANRPPFSRTVGKARRKPAISSGEMQLSPPKLEKIRSNFSPSPAVSKRFIRRNSSAPGLAATSKFVAVAFAPFPVSTFLHFSFPIETISPERSVANTSAPNPAIQIASAPVPQFSSNTLFPGCIQPFSSRKPRTNSR